ncbi:hypothetical protein H8A99_35200 [Bradyrhizobium sp. Arg68]|uniref:hypothetical protein n=1 Tax=Bradyrhizobium ivorense TaxID=2511166 RepID=UPI001E38A35B|nr:hypothetical protein [Bradyrhizobium ivorense]MCC8941549.1 hypothetical protein [Bradyrhizobium ivorense]
MKKMAPKWLLRPSSSGNRLNVYDFRAGIDVIADQDSALALGPDLSLGMSSALVRVDCKSFGLIPSKPKHFGLTIDFALRGKAARFLNLWSAFRLPSGTSGFIVGADAEKANAVRRVPHILAVRASLLALLSDILLCKAGRPGTDLMIRSGFHAFAAAPRRTDKFGRLELQTLLAAWRPPADGIRRRSRAQRTSIERWRRAVSERQALYRLPRCLRPKILSISRQDFESLWRCDMSARRRLGQIETPTYLCTASSAALAMSSGRDRVTNDRPEHQHG